MWCRNRICGSYIKLPRIKTGQRQIVTAPSSPAFRAYQRHLAARLAAIEARKGKVQKGDDIRLAVITDGRHAAIDLRLVRPAGENEPANKLNALIANVYRIWDETAALTYTRPDGSRYPLPGAGQLVFSDLGTLSVEATRGFSAYRWIKQSLDRALACRPSRSRSCRTTKSPPTSSASLRRFARGGCAC